MEDTLHHVCICKYIYILILLNIVYTVYTSLPKRFPNTL